jgi:pimeloyl-ACP methyl ester carboxylesterase
MIDRGTGVPVVVIPGLQGRWEWHAPGIEALARRCRVITYSLIGEPADGIDGLTHQLETVLDRAGVDRAVICGVSFGGIVALHFAATRPERTAGLALVSTPGPRWRADARIRRHVRWPRLLTPWFVATSPLRVTPEVVAACAGRGEIRVLRVFRGQGQTRVFRGLPRVVRVIRGLPRAAAILVRHGVRVMAAPMEPTRMAARLKVIMSMDTPADCARVAAPTLVVTGEPALDRVVPVDGTREYARAIRNARQVTLERTGHIGSVTKPARFAEIIGDFAAECFRKTEEAKEAEDGGVLFAPSARPARSRDTRCRR